MSNKTKKKILTVAGLHIAIDSTIAMFVFLLALFVSNCASAPTPPPTSYPDLHPRLGGPTYRVFDVDEIDSVDEAIALRDLYHIAEKCTGATRDYAPVRVFSVSKIEIRQDREWFDSYVGVWAIGTGWVYVRRGRGPRNTARTIVHEMAHYITELSHPEIDEIIVTCNNHMTEVMDMIDAAGTEKAEDLSWW